MIPKTKKLFISYRSSDHREVDHIAEQLRSLKDDDNTRKYTTWQDKHDLEAGKSWWDGIIDAIIDCDMFVFHLSPDYLDSAVCRAELNYAAERGRPIIPVVLESAYYISPRTQKPDIEFWQDIPAWLGKYQFLFYNDDDFFDRFERAVAVYEANWPQDIEIRRPLNPDANAVHGNAYAVYATATERALQVAFDEAKPLFRELVQRNDRDFAEICREWLVLLDRYQDLLDAKEHRAPRAVFRPKWEEYVALFPLDFIEDLYPDVDDDHPIIFDPNNLGKQRGILKKLRQVPIINQQIRPEPQVATYEQVQQAPANNEASSFRLILRDVGPKKINVIKAVRAITSLGLKETKELVESAPSVVLEEIDAISANEFKTKLENEGAKVKLEALHSNIDNPDKQQQAPANNEASSFRLILRDVGPRKINIIKAVRAITSLGLKETKELVESAPSTIIEDVDFDFANDAKKKIEQEGAVVELIQYIQTRPSSLDIRPNPFVWIEIPNKGYSIAKYPVTNAQFAKFIEAGGYNNSKWWTDSGWRQRKKYDWIQPRYWTDSRWNGAEQPVVGVSWSEAVAFCLWLSEATGEKIILPTEAQWQYAAQGDDGRDYPWGNEWDANRCNNNVNGKSIGRTTPVAHYEGKGNSPFGVVDMAGNVWEWCLIDYEDGANNFTNNHILRGGAWYLVNADWFRCSHRDWVNYHNRYYYLGFRLAKL